jgi:hypothetical protein
MSWSGICLVLLEDRLWLKEKAKELIREGNNEWLRGATSRSGSQRRATTSGRAATEGNNKRMRGATSRSGLQRPKRAGPRGELDRAAGKGAAGGVGGSNGDLEEVEDLTVANLTAANL